jgi:uncharacterized protein YoxC
MSKQILNSTKNIIKTLSILQVKISDIRTEITEFKVRKNILATDIKTKVNIVKDVFSYIKEIKKTVTSFKDLFFTKKEIL